MVGDLWLDVMGMPFRVEFAGGRRSELRRAVAQAWERCRADAPPADRVAAGIRGVRVVLDDDPQVLAEARTAGAVAGSTELAVLDELTSRLVRDGLEDRVGDRWLLHACALADPDTGATVVLVAPSGTGKTTASTTLGRELGYVSDETAVVERDGSILSFPKPLSLLVDGRRPKRQLSPEHFGLRPAPAAPWLAGVALLSRDPEIQGVRVEEVPVVEGLALLAEQTSSLHLLRDPLRTVTQMLDARGGLRRLVYGESADLLPVLRGWMTAAVPVPVTVVDPAPTVATEPISDLVEPVPAPGPRGARVGRPGPCLRRLPVLDEYVAEGAMAVLLPGEVLSLSPLASLVLLAVGDDGEAGTPLADLEQFLAAEVGPPPEGTVSEALAPVLETLVAKKLLEHC